MQLMDISYIYDKYQRNTLHKDRSKIFFFTFAIFKIENIHDHYHILSIFFFFIEYFLTLNI